MRLDKWLWAARFYKTRSLAQQAIAAGHVRLRGERVKPAHEVRPGDELELRKSELVWRVSVRLLSQRRGPAEEAAKLYEEAAESRAERERRIELRRLAPAVALKGRPTKRDRRRLEAMTGPEDE